jgi:hypothetical protein
MSTTFYALRPPATSLRVEQVANNSSLSRVSIWLSGQLAGSFLAREGELPALLGMFRGEPLFVRNATEKGTTYTWLASEKTCPQQVIDEYGDLHYFPPEGMT